MSSSHAEAVNEVIDSIPSRRVPGVVNVVGLATIVLGLISFGIGYTVSPEWAWGAVLVGIVYTLGIAAGGIVFSVIATLTWARWSRPLKRISEAFGVFLPFVWLALLVWLIIGGMGIYPWHAGTIIEPVAIEPHSAAVLHAAKPFWLSPGFFIMRQLAGVGLLLVLSMLYLQASLKPDLVMAKARLGAKAPKWWDKVIGKTASVEAEMQHSASRQATLGVFIGFAYAFVMSFIAFDLIMSIQPWWFSNMFGGWFFTSSLWLAMQAIGVFTLVGYEWLGAKRWVSTKTTHDLGKLILAFTMAWAYMLYAQLLPIWYANMPEETDALLVRMSLPEWGWLTQTVVVLCFIMPFTVLVSRGIKKLRWPFVTILLVMLIGVFLERTLLVMPGLYHKSVVPASLYAISAGVWLGFMGAMVMVVTRFLANVPIMPVADPKLEDHPWDVHVHGLDAHH